MKINILKKMTLLAFMCLGVAVKGFSQYDISKTTLKVDWQMNAPFSTDFADKLSGSDEEAIKKDAEIMAKFLRKRDVPPLAGGDPQKMDDKKTAMKNMLANLKGE